MRTYPAVWRDRNDLWWIEYITADGRVESVGPFDDRAEAEEELPRWKRNDDPR